MTRTEIFNLALSDCGSTQTIGDADERSQEAALCRLHFTSVYETLASAAPWPCFLRWEELALQGRDPAPGHYQYLYANPSLMLRPYRLASFAPFQRLAEGIVTSDHAPVMLYIRRAENPAEWDAAFRNAFIAALAAKIARPLTGDAQTVQENYEKMQIAVEDTRAEVANDEDRQFETLPDWLRARQTGLPAPIRFYYPLISARL